MPRGAKKDIYATVNARQANELLDPGSFISTSGHRYLEKGGIDIILARHRACKHATVELMGIETMRCQCGCNAIISDDYWEGHPLKAEMHHLKHKGRGGSDDDDNLAMWARKCHRGKSGEHG